MFNKKIFREKALDRLSSPEDFDIPVKIMSLKIWIFFLIFVLVLTALVIWLASGRINQQIECQGLLVKEDNLLIVSAVKAGFVENINVKPPDNIKKGDVLINILPAAEKQELSELENKLLQNANKNSSELIEKKKRLTEEYMSKSAVHAPVDGAVFEVTAARGSFVNIGDKLLSIEHKSKGDKENIFEVTGFVSGKAVHSIKEGAPVLIEPRNIDKKEFGYLKGSVKKIADYPVSQERKRIIAKEKSAIAINQGEEIYEVIIVPDLKDNMLQWSNNKTSGVNLINGTICDLKIIVTSKNFLSFIFR